MSWTHEHRALSERLVTDWLDWRGDESRGSTRVAWILESVSEKQTC